MRTVFYEGPIWDGSAVHPRLWELLLEEDLLIEIALDPPPYRVLLGVPHHAAPGIDRIAEHWLNPQTERLGRAADETTGLCGLAVLHQLHEEKIPSRLVIAAHPTDHDPNKTPGCPYWLSIFRDPLPGLLLELHGAGKVRHFDLELSAGRNDKTDPLAFGSALARYIDPHWSLAVQKRPGTREAQLYNANHASPHLENPALATSSLAYAGQHNLPALHLEMKAFLRQPDPHYPDSPRPAAPAWLIARALAMTLK